MIQKQTLKDKCIFNVPLQARRKVTDFNESWATSQLPHFLQLPVTLQRPVPCHNADKVF